MGERSCATGTQIRLRYCMKCWSRGRIRVSHRVVRVSRDGIPVIIEKTKKCSECNGAAFVYRKTAIELLMEKERKEKH